MSNELHLIPQDGAQGPQGEPGGDGASAYDIAVANGFVGDEAAWLASLVGADGQDGADGIDGAPGATGATGAAGPNLVSTSTTTNITGLIEGDGSTIVARAIGVAASTSVPTRADADARYQPLDSDLTAIAALSTTLFGRALLALADAAALRTSAGVGTMSTRSTYQVQIALSANGQNISAGTKKGLFRVPIAGTVTGFAVVCDPANEPSAFAVQVDLNTLNLTTGVATSILSSVANIATGANVSTGGAISGSPSVAVGDLLSLDIDQGTDGRELVATITITAT